MCEVIKRKIILLFITCFSIFGFLCAEDCYVLLGNDDSNGGGVGNPLGTIQQCKDFLGYPDAYDTIHVGPGIYEVQGLEIGRFAIQGAGINVTTIVPAENNQSYIFNISDYGSDWDGYGISNVTFDAHPTEGWEVDAAIKIYDINVDIYNCFFKKVGSYSIYIENSHDGMQIRNNIFKEGSIFLYKMKSQTFMNNLIVGHVEINWDYSFSDSDNHEAHFHNNVFLYDCDLPDWGIENFTYNLVFNPDGDGVLEEVNGEYYGGGDDNSCGDLGGNQSFNVFTMISQLDFYTQNWNLYNVFAIGENSILFDTGHPDSEHNDLDGSRGDIGIHAGMYPLLAPGPVITEFSVDPIVVPVDGEINVNARAVTE